MLDFGEELALRYTVAAQSVSDDATGLELETSQQALEEALGRKGIPPALPQDVEHDAVLVRRAPEVMQHAVDPQVYLIHAPGVSRPRPAPTHSPSEVEPKPQAPLPDTLVGDANATLYQDQLDIAQTQTEDLVELHRMADDLGRKTISGIGGELRHHQPSLAQPLRSG